VSEFRGWVVSCSGYQFSVVTPAEDVEPRKPGESDFQYVRRLESLGHAVAGVKDGGVVLVRRPHHPQPKNVN